MFILGMGNNRGSLFQLTRQKGHPAQGSRIRVR